MKTFLPSVFAGALIAFTANAQELTPTVRSSLLGPASECIPSIGSTMGGTSITDSWAGLPVLPPAAAASSKRPSEDGPLSSELQQVKDAVADPQRRAATTAGVRNLIAGQGSLLKMLPGFDDAALRHRLFDLLAEHEVQRRYDERLEPVGCRPTEEVNLERAQRETARVAELRQLLGKERLEQYQDFAATVVSRSDIRIVNSGLGAENKLTPEQWERLVPVWHARELRRMDQMRFTGRWSFPDEPDAEFDEAVTHILTSAQVAAFKAAAVRDTAARLKNAGSAPPPTPNVEAVKGDIQFQVSVAADRNAPVTVMQRGANGARLQRLQLDPGLWVDTTVSLLEDGRLYEHFVFLERRDGHDVRIGETTGSSSGHPGSGQHLQSRHVQLIVGSKGYAIRTQVDFVRA